MTIQDLYNKKEEIVASMRAILEKADSESRAMTDEEVASYEALDKDLDRLDQTIERMAKVEAAEADTKHPIRKLYQPANCRNKPDNPEEFRNIGEWLATGRFNPGDKRLEYREQSMGTGAEGGFAIPEKFRPEILAVAPAPAIFRPRATVIASTDPPDSALTMPRLDQTAAENIYGGIVVDWIAEGGTKKLTDLRFKEFKLEPKEVTGYLITTDKLLRNWAGASNYFTQQFRQAIAGAEDMAFYSGSGVGRPLGILNSPARIDYTRAGANAIAYADVVGMYARLKMGGSPVWIASQTTIPQLCTMTDNATGSNAIWVQNAAPGIPPTLLGIPVLFHDRSVALGTKGDLILADLSYYYILDGSGPYVAFSEHVAFTQNKTYIKIFWNVDGSPWLSAPLPLEGSTANTVSPFIVLN